MHQRCLKLRAEFVKSSKNVYIKIYRTVILPVVLYGCKTMSLTLREELRGTRKQGTGEKYIMRNFMICTSHKYYSGDQIKKSDFGQACGKCGGQDRCIQDFGGETCWELDTSKTEV